MIKLLDVQKTYKQSVHSALTGITLEVDPGEFVFLIGSSGSGKSSLLRLILREERPDSGQIYVLGNDLGSLSTSQVSLYRRRLGVVFQDFRLLPDRDVFANVAFALEVIGKSRAFISTAVPDVLRLVGLEEKSGARPSALSGGQQQRVAIARALVNRPDILLADEPTGNLDADNSAEIMNLLERINQSGTTVLMATHDQAIVDRMQRRVIALSEGKIVEDRMNVGYEVDGGSVR